MQEGGVLTNLDTVFFQIFHVKSLTGFTEIFFQIIQVNIWYHITKIFIKIQHYLKFEKIYFFG